MPKFHPYPQSFVDRIRAGGLDDYANPPEKQRASDIGAQCRSCLTVIPEGAEMLLVAARPFAERQAYAETGPIFLCAQPCTPWQGQEPGLPPSLRASPEFLLKAYGQDDRIVYGTGRITAQQEIETVATALLSDPRVAYVDVRSAKNNCFQTRITD